MRLPTKKVFFCWRQWSRSGLDVLLPPPNIDVNVVAIVIVFVWVSHMFRGWRAQDLRERGRESEFSVAVSLIVDSGLSSSSFSSSSSSSSSRPEQIDAANL